jgi:hypothetical protein
MKTTGRVSQNLEMVAFREVAFVSWLINSRWNLPSSSSCLFQKPPRVREKEESVEDSGFLRRKFGSTVSVVVFIWVRIYPLAPPASARLCYPLLVGTAVER